MTGLPVDVHGDLQADQRAHAGNHKGYNVDKGTLLEHVGRLNAGIYRNGPGGAGQQIRKVAAYGRHEQIRYGVFTKRGHYGNYQRGNYRAGGIVGGDVRQYGAEYYEQYAQYGRAGDAGILHKFGYHGGRAGGNNYLAQRKAAGEGVEQTPGDFGLRPFPGDESAVAGAGQAEGKYGEGQKYIGRGPCGYYALPEFAGEGQYDGDNEEPEGVSSLLILPSFLYSSTK